MNKKNILYIDNSEIDGKGLFTNTDLDVGECVGLLSQVFGDNDFNDTPFGRYLNHNENPNIDLKAKRDKLNNVINVLGITNKFIKKGSELTANYNDKFAPKPNFIKKNYYDFDNIMRSRSARLL